jgi:aldose 1-epimerase
MKTEPFGQTPDGRGATIYTLENARLRVRIADFGGRIVSIEAPDRNGRRGEVLLGFDSVAAFVEAGGAFGALLGRYANRIAGGAVTIDERSHTLSRNERNNTLHGGAVGFDKVLWTVTAADETRLHLRYVSPDGDQGFPGELTVDARYRLEEDTLSLAFEAKTNAPTVINLSAHPYFNLAGTGDVLSHELMLAADAFLPTNAEQIPTGELRPVAGTPFDFRVAAALGARIGAADEQLLIGHGYDQCFVLRPQASPAARVTEPKSGRVLEMYTDQPGIQLYTSNWLNGRSVGHGGVAYQRFAGLCLEPQDFPDAPHHPNFPQTVLRPGQVYRRMIRYRFTTI